MLIAYTAIATYLGHPFWRGGPDLDGNLIHALKNVSIAGGLATSVAFQRLRLVNR